MEEVPWRYFFAGITLLIMEIESWFNQWRKLCKIGCLIMSFCMMFSFLFNLYPNVDVGKLLQFVCQKIDLNIWDCSMLHFCCNECKYRKCHTFHERKTVESFSVIKDTQITNPKFFGTCHMQLLLLECTPLHECLKY